MRIEEPEQHDVVLLLGPAQERPRVIEGLVYLGRAVRLFRVKALPQRIDDRVDLDGLHVARPVAQGRSRVVAGARAHDQDAVATLGKAEGRVIRAFIAVAAGDFGV